MKIASSGNFTIRVWGLGISNLMSYSIFSEILSLHIWWIVDKETLVSTHTIGKVLVVTLQADSAEQWHFMMHSI